MCSCVNVCMCADSDARNHPLLLFHLLLWGSIAHSSPEVTTWLALLSGLLSGSLSPHTKTEFTGRLTHPPGIFVGSKDLNPVFHPECKHLSHWAVSLVPPPPFKDKLISFKIHSWWVCNSVWKCLSIVWDLATPHQNSCCHRLRNKHFSATRLPTGFNSNL